MKSVQVTVVNEIGIHARPASFLVNLVKGYTCDIECYKNGNTEKRHQTKSILSVMAMGAKKGDELTFNATGEDEEAAIAAIEAFVKSGCGE